MPDLELKFEVFCEECGEGLCRQCTEGRTYGRDMPFISVEPCKKCLANAKSEGYEEGYDKGFEKGTEEANND